MEVIKTLLVSVARFNQQVLLFLRHFFQPRQRRPSWIPISGRENHSGDQQHLIHTAGTAGIVEPLPPRLRVLPLQLPQRRKVLVLDLDETLIHSSTRGSPLDYDTKIEVVIDRQPCLFYVYKRPYAGYFLNQVSKWYDLAIFTASMPEYAGPVIDWLDPYNLIKRRYFRESCTQREGNFLKNLTIVESDLSQVFIIDNSPSVYSIVPDNAIPIEGWYSDRNDQVLLDLLPFLDALRYCDDVRAVLSLRSS